MITWIQVSFGKHHKLLLGALLAITIVSFVFFGSWSGAAARRGANTYLGVDLNSQRELAPYHDVAMVLGQSGVDTLTLIFYTHLADAAQIPEPDDARLAKYYQEQLGNGDIARAATIRDIIAQNLQNNSRTAIASPDDAKRRVDDAFRRWYRIEEALKKFRPPAYALPFEGLHAWRAENTRWTIATATLPGAAFNPKIEVTDEKLNEWYGKNKAQFTIKPRVSAAAAIFTAKPEDAVIKPSDPSPTDSDLRTFAMNYPDIVKAKIPTFDISKIDEQFAANRATLAKIWTDTKVPLDHLGGRVTEWLDKQLPGGEPISYDRAKRMLTENGAEVIEVAPFESENTVPKDTKVPATLLQNALKLSREEWRSGQYDLPITAGKPAQVVVFLHRKTDPAYVPELAEVREKVVAAYTDATKAELWNARGSEVWKQLNDALASGQKFADAAKALGMTEKSYPPFKVLPTEFPPDLILVAGALLPELNRTPVGALTPKLANGADTLFVRVEKRDTPEPKTPEELAAVTNREQEIALSRPQLALAGVPKRGITGLIRELQATIAPVKQQSAAVDAEGE